MRIPFNSYHPIPAFQEFGGKCLGTVDAIDMLCEADKAALLRIMVRIGKNARALANDESRAAEIRRDDSKVAAAFEKWAA